MNKIITAMLSFAFAITVNAQEKKSDYKFETVYDVPSTSVKSQGQTGTCWSFSTTSFIEAEILRETGKNVDLSEMYNARIVYPQKAQNFVGRQGKAQFSEGGLNHDVIRVIRENGIVIEEAYHGHIVDPSKYNHAELANLLGAYVKAIAQNKGGKLSTVWLPGFEAVLDTYLGEVPDEFTFEGKKYTPASFRDAMKIDADNYVQFTSFNAYPYNSTVVLNMPDNWANGSYYNLELNEYQNLVVTALKKGYTVTIDADVSESTFNAGAGLAIIPNTDLKEMSAEEKEKLFKEPITEKVITPEYRQQEFDNLNTTDDHLMHITGLLKDQNGTLYFRVKNSWGTKRVAHEGNVYFSEAFFKLKSISVMMHKDAVPSKLKNKLGIK